MSDWFESLKMVKWLRGHGSEIGVGLLVTVIGGLMVWFVVGIITAPSTTTSPSSPPPTIGVLNPEIASVDDPNNPRVKGYIAGLPSMATFTAVNSNTSALNCTPKVHWETVTENPVVVVWDDSRLIDLAPDEVRTIEVKGSFPDPGDYAVWFQIECNSDLKGSGVREVTVRSERPLSSP